MSGADAPAAWIGRTQTAADELAPFPARAAAATFDDDPDGIEAGAPLPPLWHWFYFLAAVRQSDLGADGHPARGRGGDDQMPPIALPRRMFAGARLDVHAPLVLGRPARRDSVIVAVREKTGASGRLAFVTVRHRIAQDGQTCLTEEQDIVYRGGAAGEAAQKAPAPPAAPPPAPWWETVTPDPVLLFRFSCLTFNAHRIHYDQAYARDNEGYPGLVVHGPLTALLLARLIGRNTGRPLIRFAFRALAPAFAGAPLHLIGRPQGDTVALAAHAPDGRTVMTADARLG